MAVQANDALLRSLTIVSFNMHGFNQGFPMVRDLCLSSKPDVFLLQEHWLTPANMNRFEQVFPGYFVFGSSAMTNTIETGVLRGRPFGGVIIMISDRLRKFTCVLHSSDRYVMVKLFDYLLVNVYFPCIGTADRLLTVDCILNELSAHLCGYADCNLLLGGDFNCDLDSIDPASTKINQFIAEHQLHRCDQLVGCPRVDTYMNDALNHSSCLDYFLLSDRQKFIDFNVIDEGSNLSDHLPIVVVCRRDDKLGFVTQQSTAQDKNPYQTYLRWDHADINKYYFLTGQMLQSLLSDFIAFENSVDGNFYVAADKLAYVNKVYDQLVNILNVCANNTVPARRKQFYKFWWNEELDCLKYESKVSHELWKSAGKPRSGSVFNRYKSSKLLYKKRIREYQQQETESYTNDLHEALLKKHGTAFWKIWRSKFEKGCNVVGQVDGMSDAIKIVEKFEENFSKIYSCLSEEGSRNLKDIYDCNRTNYCGVPFDDSFLFDVELVDRSVRSLRHGKAAGSDSLTAEHLQYCHPALATLTCKLFNLIIQIGSVPEGFGCSYTVPIPKINSTAGKALSVDDFRGITISPVISKVFEKCVLDRYQCFLETSENQFGFKKALSCSHAIYSVKATVDYYVNQGTTVSLCALDLHKAFDKMNHHGLFNKLMERMIPNSLLETIEHWFRICTTCVKWGNSTSKFITLNCGIRQGGVLSPYFFALYIDDVVKTIDRSNYGCRYKSFCISVFLYADDIILIAPSVTALQALVNICERQLATMDMALNASKSVCIRFGPRCDCECCPLMLSNGKYLKWVTSCRYLGVYFESSRQFKCCFHNNRRAYFRSFNAIFGKVGRFASEEVILNLIYLKCLPVLLFGLDAAPVKTSDKHSFDFVMTRTLMKLFRTGAINVINDCETIFNLRKISSIIQEKKMNFLVRYINCENGVCQLLSGMAYKELLTLCN